MSFDSIYYDRPIPDMSEEFEISCPSNTDVWEKPPSTHSFNAPIIYRKVDLSSFVSARVTVSAEWKHKYDQGGICLVINKKDGKKHWVKTGIEFLDDVAHVSTVATDRWSDWSLRPTLPATPNRATLEMERKPDGVLWVWLIADDGSKIPAREVNWMADLPTDVECWVGVYVAKPAKENEELTVHFKDLEISLA